jgi:hypothetical protein
MSNKKITDLPELTNPTTDDVFPIVDIATNTTLKVQVGNLPVQTAVATALATKQETLVSGTNIKTVNSTSLVGSGNVAVQPTLVSGTNIKTINGATVLGAGDIAVVTSPSGVSGAIQFSNGSAFASDAANLFWDDTNNRLGVGTNAPSNTTEIQIPSTYVAIGSNANLYLTSASTSAAIKIGASGSGSGCAIQATQSGGGTAFNLALNPFGGSVNVGNSHLGASLGIKGSGSTSATTSLLVQNSAGTQTLKVDDAGNTTASVLNASSKLQISALDMLDLGAGLRIQYNANPQRTTLFTNLSGGGMQWYASGSCALGNSTTEVASAVFNTHSTTKGFLPPVMTTTQKNAIASPATGLVLYDATTNKLQCYNGSTWNDLF